jgi:hypothetical protein
MYVNGTLASTTEIGAPSGILKTDVPYPVYIGNTPAGTYTSSFDGMLDDVRLYNRLLSAGEVKRIYELGATTRISETVTANPTLETGLVGHWTFDGPDTDWSSTTAEVRDRSGQGNHGDTPASMSSTVSSAPGVLGQGMHFDGIDDYINALSATSLDDIGSGNGTGLTISAYINPKGLGESNDGRIVQKSTANVGGDLPVNGWAFYVTDADLATNALKFSVDDSTTHTQRSTVANSISLNTWQHVVAVWDGSTNASNIHLYVNGVEPAYNFTDNGVSRASDVSSSLYIGNNVAGSNTFDGSIDDVRIYNRILSPAEVKRLYELGS